MTVSGASRFQGSQAISGKRTTRILATAILAAPLLSGCTDLSAVREFAGTSGAIAADEPVISGWPHTYDKVASLAGTAAVDASHPGARQAFIDENRSVTADAALGEASAKMLALYMQALGQLAGGSLVDFSKQASEIQSSATKLGATKPEVTAASKAIELLLAAWQQEAVSDAVRKANPAVQVLTSYLAATSDAVRLADAHARAASDEYWGGIGIDSHRNDIEAFSLRAMQEDDSYYAALQDKAAPARDAFLKIGRDHAALSRDPSDLKDALAVLKADLPALQSSLATLTK